ncbi:MAG: 1-acyl-sn-glycerol-3-phosphate acyltransferase [Deltaproteobacteria bacterium]|nr:1-acyl-sn-glycerol-3-phosphate acyltransferase [Deltaproteobacteria bacterium]
MTLQPHISPDDPEFPGDSSPQPPFGLLDSFRSIGVWSIGAPHLAFWAAFTSVASKYSDIRKLDGAIKFMCRAVPMLAGVKVTVTGRDRINANDTYVYIVNHVNIFDMFAIYQAIPTFARSLEHVSHFSWPLIGPFITAAGQIPVDPEDPKLTAKGLKKAVTLLKSGNSLAVLPEGERTLDGSVGHFYSGAFRLAIQGGVPVVPMAIHGGRTVSRRGDWRVRPGSMKVIFGDPVSSKGYPLRDAGKLAQICRDKVIALLQEENRCASRRN